MGRTWAGRVMPLMTATLLLVPAAAIGGTVFAARSYCSITGATGMGYGQTHQIAASNAIGYCVAAGGVPDCCLQGVHLAGVAFTATAYCAVTSRSGSGMANTQQGANQLAILQCIANGGIPDCCRNGLVF
ncbi:MAG: hypothetical protein CAPSK01_001987 [Candidatus Accumulibacter vicinus]|uniref:DUF4189 domain-containing protein n=1 Tax=Candidatus Accumulibacter vicinus TaxID=2954382 RepID=A0A084Y091_9PROT|nr:MAG: hypothetical protein CAPSK01_001987 [Candidatus Accumulibacter vicinus]